MPAGRPSTYNAKYHIPWVKSLARRGLTVQEIAEEIGVAKSTLCKWVSENVELSDALNEGRGYADSLVEDSLYKRALGFTYSEKKTIVSSADTGQKPLKIEIVEKESLPDTTACIFWLKNRNPQAWRDTSNISLRTDADIESVKAEIENMILNNGQSNEGTSD